VVTPENRAFLTAGQHGQLVICRCQDCGQYLHPPAPVCGYCLSVAVRPEPVSGQGTVYTFTVNEYPWHPAFPPPYVVAIVELDEQPSVRLTTNIVGCAPDEVRVGLPVRVAFVDCGELFLPVFTPRAAAR
jgi:hypothetical protein